MKLNALPVKRNTKTAQSARNAYRVVDENSSTRVRMDLPRSFLHKVHPAPKIVPRNNILMTSPLQVLRAVVLSKLKHDETADQKATIRLLPIFKSMHTRCKHHVTFETRRYSLNNLAINPRGNSQLRYKIRHTPVVKGSNAKAG